MSLRPTIPLPARALCIALLLVTGALAHARAPSPPTPSVPTPAHGIVGVTASIDGRHLRAFKMAADREIGMVEQAIAPYLRRSEGRGDVVAEVLSLVINFHAALVRSGLEK